MACSMGDSQQAPDSYMESLTLRKQLYGPNAALSYSQPLMIVRGEGTYLYDQDGNRYLDCVNNVAHLGHCHPEVAQAVCQQMCTLNTNSRYLHPALPAYTARLLATFNVGRSRSSPLGSITAAPAAGAATPSAQPPAAPETAPGTAPEPLASLYLVCSGSEANDLALRIVAAARPGATHMAVMAGAYHGHTVSLIPLSSYKFWGTGGSGRQANVLVLPCPDPYRGENLDGALAARQLLSAARRVGGTIGGFICESIPSCGGQIIMPPGYLQAVYRELQGAGVVCIADEVQVGFGRCGEAFWAFQAHGVAPDIVTIGKPMGNGYPIAGLVTTKRLAGAFAAGGMEYFNTYGGSTAAVAAGMAVLKVLQEQDLQQHAREVGRYLLEALRPLQAAHECVGDVRGMGLMVGLEVVRDKQSKQHAPLTARWLKERCKARRVLLSTDGPYDNIIKVKPPMVFGMQEARVLVEQLSDVLDRELTPAVRARLDAEEDVYWASVMAPRRALHAANERQLEEALKAVEAAGGSAAGAAPVAASRL